MRRAKVVKENCYHFKHRAKSKSGCRALTTLMCDKKGKCGFFETVYSYEKRQRDFKARHGIEE